MSEPRPLDPKCPFCREVLIQPTTLVKVHCPGCDITFRLVAEHNPANSALRQDEAA